MNHIYKVIWNRARACWQVVSELAKNKGKQKSSRRQRLGGCAMRRLLSRTAALTAFAIGLTCLLVGLMSVARADDGTTTASGLLSYDANNNLNAFAKSLFSDWASGTITQAGTTSTNICLNDGPSPILVFTPDCTNNGNPEGMAMETIRGLRGKYFRNFMQTEYNSKGYTALVAVIYVPDASHPGSTVAQPYTLYTTTSGVATTSGYTDYAYWQTLVKTINNAYWNSPAVIAEFTQAYQESQSSDLATKAAGQAKLEQLTENGLPHIYLATDSAHWQNGTLLTLGTTTSNAVVYPYSNSWQSASPIGLAIQTTTLSSKPSDSTYSYSYTSQNVAAGGVWRPLDRVTTSAGTGGTYSTTGASWTIGSNGATSSGAPVTADNSGSIVLNPTIMTVNNLAVGKGGTIDLSYLNTHYDINGNYNPLDPAVSHDYMTANGQTSLYGQADYEGYYSIGNGNYRWLNRDLLVQNASLADGTTLRLGVYGSAESAITNKVGQIATIGSNSVDAVYIKNATTPDSHANLYITLGWVPGLGHSTQGEAAYSTQNGYPLLLGIESGASNFTVSAQSSVADGIFSQYKITPVIGELDNYFTNSSGSAITGSTAWYLQSYSYLDLGTASESGRSAADNNLIMNNLWRNDYLNMFRRVGSLHRLGLTPQPPAAPGKAASVASNSDDTASSNPASWKAGLSAAPAPVEDQKENIWAETWHGQYHSAAGYGRTVGQNYNGLEVGYDKLLNHDIADGKVYAGIYASNVEGDSNTATGGGTQKSQGLGLYETWVGKKGHYLDVALLASHLKDNYHLTGNTGSGVGQINGDYSTWGYGLGVQYGYHDALKSNWYWEPSASLYAGWINGLSYSLSNNLGIQQNNASTLTGRLGMQIGKQLDNGQGSVHAGVALLHEFENGTAMHEFFGDQTRTLDTMGGKDTWWEFNVGGNYRISPTGVFNLDVSKTDGSRVGSGWQINGGLNWTWGGFWSSNKASSTATPKATKNETVKPEKNVTVIVGRPENQASQMKVAADAVKQPAEAKQEKAVAKGQTAAKEQIVPKAVKNETPSSAAASTTDKEPVAANAAQGDAVSTDNAPTRVQPAEAANTATNTVETGEYSFAPVTVEAERPDWEKSLSPGQVSIIYPEKFEGEQKDLPDLLERVPGLFVQRVSGAGHYTVARVRGSTAAEVAVYVDGVLINLNSEAAVNLSAIPVDNVERIEVYRGYVPVQFSGAPMGGVINIITKKPKEVGGSISQGFKSYGGYNATYQLTAPVGDGSLLATFQRDIWGGNFPFLLQYQGFTSGVFNRRSNGYQNDDGMVKWQDDHWNIKASWKQLHEQLPRSVAVFRTGSGVGNIGHSEWYEKGYYDAKQDIDEKEFQIGRRDTAGNLDWGWKVSYIDSRKSYRDTGLIKEIADGIYNVSGFGLNPGEVWAEYHSKKWAENLNGAWKLGNSHLLEFNADISQERMHANGDDWSNAMFSSNYMTTNPYSSDVMLSDYRINEYHLNLQDTMTLNEAGDFKFTPIVRADKVDMESFGGNDQQWKYSGGAALQKQLNDHWSVKTTWGTYNRHPNFYELFGDGSDIQPNVGAAKFFGLNGNSTWETGTQFDFSLNWQGKLAKADTETVLTWFDRHSQNQLVLWTPLAPHAPSTYLPMDSTQVHGLELTHTMTWNRLTMSLAATWQESKMKSLDMANYLSYTRSMTYMPEWVYNIRFDYRFPGDKLNVFTEYHYTDRQYIGMDDQDQYDQYIDALGTVNVGMKYAFNPKWELSAGVNDLFNKGYEERMHGWSTRNYSQGGGSYLDDMGTVPYPFAGRMYYMTMKYKF